MEQAPCIQGAHQLETDRKDLIDFNINFALKDPFYRGCYLCIPGSGTWKSVSLQCSDQWPSSLHGSTESPLKRVGENARRGDNVSEMVKQVQRGLEVLRASKGAHAIAKLSMRFPFLISSSLYFSALSVSRIGCRLVWV
jgi:hypothetical protein